MNSDEHDGISRRRFAQNAMMAAGAIGSARGARDAAPAAEVKIGLYSITYGGVWYSGDALAVEQVIGA